MYKFFHRCLLVTVSMVVLLSAYFVATPASAAYCNSGEPLSRGWIKNVDTAKKVKIWFWGEAGWNCDGRGLKLAAGQDSNLYTDDTDGYWYSQTKTWTVRHGPAWWHVKGDQKIEGWYAVWCNYEADNLNSDLLYRCDW